MAEDLHKVSSTEVTLAKITTYQNQIHLLELLTEFLGSHFSKFKQTQSFIQDLVNNNEEGTEGDQESVRNLLLHECQKLIKTLQKELLTWNSEYQSLTRRISEWNLYRNQVNIDLEHLSLTFREYTALRGDIIGVYSKELKALLSILRDSKHKFQFTPKGPIGACFSVLGDWMPIVEHIMKPVAFTFLVHDRSDYKVLQGMIDAIYGNNVPIWTEDAFTRPCVWITSFCLPEFKVETCSKGSETLISLSDVVKIYGEDMVVTKFLLDYTQMHRLLLFKTQHEAFPVLSESKILPKGCLAAYTLDFYKVSPHPCFKSNRVIPHGQGVIELQRSQNSRKAPDSSLNEANLKKFKHSRDELEQLLRNLKCLQLKTCGRILDRRSKIERLQKGVQYLKVISWAKIASLLEIIASAEKKEEMQKKVELLATKLKADLIKIMRTLPLLRR